MKANIKSNVTNLTVAQIEVDATESINIYDAARQKIMAMFGINKVSATMNYTIETE